MFGVWTGPKRLFVELHLLALVFLFLTAVPKERLGIRVHVRDRKCNFRSFRPLLPSPLPRSQFLLISDFFASFLKGETTEIFKLLQFYPTFYLKDINRSPRTRGNGGDLGTKHFPPFGWSFKKKHSVWLQQRSSDSSVYGNGRGRSEIEKPAWSFYRLWWKLFDCSWRRLYLFDLPSGIARAGAYEMWSQIL